MKKNFVIAILSCILLTSCETDYTYKKEYYLDNQTSESIYMTYCIRNYDTSSVYEISPYEKFHLNIIPEYEDVNGTPAARIYFESITLKYKDNTYLFTYDNSDEDVYSPVNTTCYTYTPYFISDSSEKDFWYLFSLTEEFFEESEEYIVD